MTRQVHLGQGLGRRPRTARKNRRKLVLVGTSAVGLNDLKTTPVHPAMPGVEVHAQILESALTKATLNRPGSTALAEIGIAVLVGLALVGWPRWSAPAASSSSAASSRP
jgi:CHASE2 domain-containing sensor protein